MSLNISGLGDTDFKIAAYIENRPAFMNVAELEHCQPLVDGEIYAIGQACGNGWRKVFNVYAKLLFTLPQPQFHYRTLAPDWQGYRDKHLLQQGSHTALLFSPPALKPDDNRLHIIMGRTYAKRLINESKISAPLTWLDNEFAINAEHKLFVCPYFDYRQLSNIKIEKLVELVTSIQANGMPS